MKINLPLIADTLFVGICTFLLVFTLARYYLKNAAISLICGIVGGVALAVAAFFYIRRRQNKKLLYGKEAEEKRKLAMHLCLLSCADACSLIIKATGGVKRGKRIESGEKIYFPVFKAEPCDMDDLMPLIRLAAADKEKIFICNYIADNARKLAENCGIAVFDCGEVYKLLKKAEALPESYLYAEPQKLKLIKRIKLRFSRKLCLPAFWSGAGLMFMSWFTFYPVYYIISGAVLLVICVLAAIFGQPKSI
ncbi:MAG: hypothetical protein LUD27_05320 [Clostridia bacterium]|nr:hypothetical protein [Clostridia bacterium]